MLQQIMTSPGVIEFHEVLSLSQPTMKYSLK